MIYKLNKELTDALHRDDSSPLPVVDPTDNKIYAIVNLENLSDDARRKLKTQMDIEAIQEGLDQVARGEVVSLKEAMMDIRRRILSKPDK